MGEHGAETQAAMRITCFGELRVEVGGRDVTPELPGRQGRALLAHLVLSAPGAVSRDALVRSRRRSSTSR